jgi:hypothetical protein
MKKLRDRSKMPTRVMTNKELLDHFTGIKVFQEMDRYGKMVSKFRVCDDAYEIEVYERFLFAAAFIGVAASKIKQEKTVKVSVPLVWELRNYMVSFEGNKRGSDDEYAAMIMDFIKMASALIGFGVEVTYKDHRFYIGDVITELGGNEGNGGGYITFDTLGIQPERFFRILAESLYMGGRI